MYNYAIIIDIIYILYDIYDIMKLLFYIAMYTRKKERKKETWIKKKG